MPASLPLARPRPHWLFRRADVCGSGRRCGDEKPQAGLEWGGWVPSCSLLPTTFKGVAGLLQHIKRARMNHARSPPGLRPNRLTKVKPRQLRLSSLSLSSARRNALNARGSGTFRHLAGAPLPPGGLQEPSYPAAGLEACCFPPCPKRGCPSGFSLSGDWAAPAGEFPCPAGTAEWQVLRKSV